MGHPLHMKTTLDLLGKKQPKNLTSLMSLSFGPSTSTDLKILNISDIFVF